MRAVSFPFFTLFIIFLFHFAGCESSKSIIDDRYDETRVIALLKERVQPEMLVDSFKEYGLEKLGPASRTFNEWMFSYDSSLISGQDILDKIRNSTMVEKADFPEKPTE